MKSAKRIAGKVVNTLMLATGVVFFWRGTWGLMDLYIHPDDPLVSYLISIALGLGILIYTHHLFDGLR